MPTDVHERGVRVGRTNPAVGRSLIWARRRAVRGEPSVVEQRPAGSVLGGKYLALRSGQRYRQCRRRSPGVRITLGRGLLLAARRYGYRRIGKQIVEVLLAPPVEPRHQRIDIGVR